MKLGLYGGGFKPFTTGHFSKLANAIRDNDQVILFYGLQERKPPKLSKTTGKPLKSQQKFRKIGDTKRLYTPEISKEIFDIYESAIEREIPSIELESTIGTTPMRRIFEILESFAADPSLYEKVTIYGGSDMPAPYLRELHRFEDLVRSGKIQFGAVAPESIDDYLDEVRLAKLVERSEEQAAISLAKHYYPDFDPEVDEIPQDILAMARVRGTAVRGHAATEPGVEEAKRFLPPFLNDDEKQRVIDILLGKTDSPQTESRMRNVLMRATARFARERLLREQAEEIKSAPPGRESHIYNLYEDLAMPLSDIVEIGRLALDGKLENFQEKVDGQNVTFTVHNGVLRFFVKLSLVTDRELERNRQKIQSGHGMDLALINEKYADKPGVATAFSMAYEAIEPIALQFQDSLFKNGDVVVVSGLITSVNPNTIIYDADTLRFITPVSLTDEPVNQEVYDQFLQQARAATTDAFSMDSVPTAKLVEDLETDDTEIESLMSHLETVVGDVGLSVGSATVGDYIGARVEKLLREKYKFIPEELVEDVANRFMTGRGTIANRLKKLVTPDQYQQFRQLDSTKADVVAEAIVPLEEVIQRLGVMIIDKLDLVLTASNQDELLVFVRNVRDQFAKGSIIADEKTLEKIRVALTRLEANEALFTKATEGIVFTFNGNTYKLTGLFTPINRLRGFFEYGSATLPQMYSDEMNEVIIRATRRFLQEGGGVFKDSTGAALTVDIELANVESTLRDFSSKFLEPLGLGDYGTIGSTAKASLSGDLDLAFPVPKDVIDDKDKLKLHKKEIKSNLISMGAIDVDITASNIYVLFPISGETQAGEFVQVDLMPTSCVADTCWLMSGVGDEGIKGTYRNQLLNLIARERGLEGNPREKMTIAYPGGLQRKTLPERDHRGNPIDPSDPKSKRKWKNVGPKISDPASILGMLGVPAAPEDVETFEELVDVMLADLDLSGYLPKFEEYMFRHLSSEKSAAFARRAVDHVNAAISGRQDEILAEVYLRNTIRKILTEASSASVTSVTWAGANEAQLKMIMDDDWVWNSKSKAGEGSEVAVVANENLNSGVSVSLTTQGEPQVTITHGGTSGDFSNRANTSAKGKLILSDAAQILTGYGDWPDAGGGQPPFPWKTVGGNVDHDILGPGGKKYEVKKFKSDGVTLARLGDATIPVFLSKNSEVMNPLRKVGMIGDSHRETVFAKDYSDNFKNTTLPGASELGGLLESVREVLFEKTYRGGETPGLVDKITGGALSQGFVTALNNGTLIEATLMDSFKTGLDSSLQSFSPTRSGGRASGRKRYPTKKGDNVGITANLGDKEKKYKGEVSFDYFFDDLIYRMYKGPDEDNGTGPSDDQIKAYKHALVILGKLYPLFKKIHETTGEPLDTFIPDLKYDGGLIGVDDSGYKIIPLEKLTLKSTTQGFRSVLKIK